MGNQLRMALIFNDAEHEQRYQLNKQKRNQIQI